MKPYIICIEGSDSSGKQTHTKMLAERLTELGYKVQTISFPQYDNESSVFVKKYLAGDYGHDAMQVNPYVASMFFIQDRMVSYLNSWKSIVENEDLDIVIMDRYVTSNLLHQGCKIEDHHDLVNFINWENDLEYKKLGLPVPNNVYYLDMPRWAAKKLSAGRVNKATGGDKQDIHEADEAYMETVYTRASVIVQTCGWTRVRCANSHPMINPVTKEPDFLDNICPIQDINDRLMRDVIACYDLWRNNINISGGNNND